MITTNMSAVRTTRGKPIPPKALLTHTQRFAAGPVSGALRLRSKARNCCAAVLVHLNQSSRATSLLVTTSYNYTGRKQRRRSVGNLVISTAFAMPTKDPCTIIGHTNAYLFRDRLWSPAWCVPFGLIEVCNGDRDVQAVVLRALCPCTTRPSPCLKAGSITIA